jgi:nucleoside-specific outer membrane channel protein Tsx
MRYLLPFILLLQLVQAEEFSLSSLSYHYGVNQEQTFNDTISSGALERYSFEHFGTWSLGTNYLFAETSKANYSGEFTASSLQSAAYAFVSWSPTLSLSKLLDKNVSYLFIKDIAFAGTFESSFNYDASMVGLAFSLDLFGFDVWDLSLMMRNDNYNTPQAHLTFVWEKSFELGLPFLFSGFINYYGTNNGAALFGEPQLLIQGSAIGKPYEALAFGVSLYMLNAPFFKEQYIPTAVVKWTW